MLDLDAYMAKAALRILLSVVERGLHHHLEALCMVGILLIRRLLEKKCRICVSLK